MGIERASQFFPAVAREVHGEIAHASFADLTSNAAEATLGQLKRHVMAGGAGALAMVHDACLYLADTGEATVQCWRDREEEATAALHAVGPLNPYHDALRREEAAFRRQLEVPLPDLLRAARTRTAGVSAAAHHCAGPENPRNACAAAAAAFSRVARGEGVATTGIRTASDAVERAEAIVAAQLWPHSVCVARHCAAMMSPAAEAF